MRNTFDKSDIYIICRMTPLSYGISRCEDEIAKCEWMKIINSPDPCRHRTNDKVSSKISCPWTEKKDLKVLI